MHKPSSSKKMKINDNKPEKERFKDIFQIKNEPFNGLISSLNGNPHPLRMVSELKVDQDVLRKIKNKKWSNDTFQSYDSFHQTDTQDYRDEKKLIRKFEKEELKDLMKEDFTEYDNMKHEQLLKEYLNEEKIKSLQKAFKEKIKQD